MAGSYYTWKESMALEAHAALSDGVGVLIAADSNHFNGKTGLAAAGGKVDYITATKATEAGQSIDVARVNLGDIVQLRAAGAITFNADVAVNAAGAYVAAVATDNVQYRALQAAEDGSVFSAVRVDAFVKA